MKLKKQNTVGIFLLVLGLLFKVILNHNFEYWTIIKCSTVILLFAGLVLINLNIWNKFENKKGISKNSKKLIFGIFTVLMVIGAEKSGKYLNYQLRNYFLKQETKITQAEFIEHKKIHLIRTGQEEFYIFKFEFNGKIYNKGILIDYSKWEGNELKDYSLKNGKMEIIKTKGGKVKIEYSTKYPSFLRIIE